MTAKRVLVVAEKPSVARDIGAVLGCRRRQEGWLEGDSHVVTWALGHLVTLPEPHQVESRWKSWRMADLPMLPEVWPLQVAKRTASQFKVVQGWMRKREIGSVVCATDAGREGELIFRLLYEAAGCRKKVQRLWISSLTPEAIRAGFAQLKPASAYDHLADAARARSRADWLVGMNLSRAYSLAGGEPCSVGRVQTPTLAMVVARDAEIRDFVPKPFVELHGTFGCSEEPGGRVSDGDGDGETYRGVYVRWLGRRPVDPGAAAVGGNGDKRDDEGFKEPERLLPEDPLVQAVQARVAQAEKATVHSLDKQTRRAPPPLLYDLTELQRHANRLYGLSAERTLAAAQTLYERHKAISYPRTDSRVLSSDVAATLPAVVETVRAPYADKLVATTGVAPLGRRFVNDAKVSDHHAIIPTERRPAGLREGSDEWRIYDLVCRRFLAAWQPDHVWAVTTLVTAVTTGSDRAGAAITDYFRTRGTTIEALGWRGLDVHPPKSERLVGGRGGGVQPENIPAQLKRGDTVRVRAVERQDKATKPPPAFNEATLLTGMETSGNTLDDQAVSEAMRERGLGTPATRAATIETLLTRGYLCRDKRQLRATERGAALVAQVHEQVKSPAMTGAWELQLKRVERGEVSFERFMRDIEAYVREVVEGVRGSSDGLGMAAPVVRSASGATGAPTPAPALVTAPRTTSADRIDRAGQSKRQSEREVQVVRERPDFDASMDLKALLRRVFGFEAFRPHQEGICSAVRSGADALVVMPTGAGKSLCYQLPGLARGGTTLVISPLIALMEDQVHKLVSAGLRAERIHSGRDRMESRAVCHAYLAGELDFLFVAPERLGVPGFPQMLGRRRPTLIAIDEAHCISQWGHDFRPDYRMLKERLPAMLPAPIMALTATATPQVQDDIVAQLNMGDADRFIHGFRRDNLSIEVCECRQAERPPMVCGLLGVGESTAGAGATKGSDDADPSEARLPAIVYAPTRKQSEAVADAVLTLGRGRVRCAAYHAGMSTAARDDVQGRFLSGALDVIVATSAFGMGVDKANVRTIVHTGLPGSIEAYYQEIGRAGRDGLPARAVLLHAYSDRRTHEFFHDRDYPEPGVLAQVVAELGEAPVPLVDVARRVGMDEEALQRVAEKLWIHGGARIDADETMRRGDRRDWKASYVAQRQHHHDQLEGMVAYTEATRCRMLHLVQHFGDQEDSGAACGQCDVCAPAQTLGSPQGPPTAAQQELLTQLLSALVSRDQQATGKLFREHFEERLSRNEFEQMLRALARADLVSVYDDAFDKDGRTIRFQRVELTLSGRRAVHDVGVLTRSIFLPASLGTELATAAAAKSSSKRRGVQIRRRGGAGGAGLTGGGKRSSELSAAALGDGDGPAADADLVEALRQWRLAEARRQKVPAFRILSNRVLLAVASAQPRSTDGLAQVHGIGGRLLEKYGDAILGVVASHRRAA